LIPLRSRSEDEDAEGGVGGWDGPRGRGLAVGEAVVERPADGRPLVPLQRPRGPGPDPLETDNTHARGDGKGIPGVLGVKHGSSMTTLYRLCSGCLAKEMASVQWQKPAHQFYAPVVMTDES